MKKKIFFILVISFFISFFLISEISAESITGRVTSQPIDLNLSVTVSGPPSLTINRPISGTYLTNEILLNYSVSGENIVYYNIDYGINITVSSSLMINVTNGIHILNLFAENGDEEITNKSVNFVVNTSLFSILYNNYKLIGDSTNFNSFTYEELGNLNNIVLENPTKSKIAFREEINVTDSLSTVADLDSYSNLSFNYVEINSDLLPQFNKSAKIYLYNLGFSNPRILKNGQLCPTSECVIENYSAGTLIFNVSGFSNYSAEENPLGNNQSNQGGNSGSSGGGGGGGEKTQETPSKITINPSKVAVEIKQRENKTVELEIKNNLNKRIILTISSDKLDNLMQIRDRYVELEALETKKIAIDFAALKDEVTGVHIGTLILNSTEIYNEIPVAVTVNPYRALFDVSVDIPDEYHDLLPGEILVFITNIVNLENAGPVDVLFEYSIVDKGGKLIFNKFENLTIDGKLSPTRKIKLPDNIDYGDYLLVVNIPYGIRNESSASGSQWFSVVKRNDKTNGSVPWILLAWGIVTAIIVVYLIRKSKNEKDNNKIRKKGR